LLFLHCWYDAGAVVGLRGLAYDPQRTHRAGFFATLLVK